MIERGGSRRWHQNAAYRRHWRTLLSVLFAFSMVGALVSASPASAAPADDGEWSELADWAFIPIHAFVDETGNLVTYGGNRDGGQGGYEVDVWNPSLGFGPASHTTIANELGTNLFCSISVSDAAGQRSFMLGGQTTSSRTNTFSAQFDNNVLADADDLVEPRWYPTATTLGDGRIVLQGGIPNGFGGRNNPITVAEMYTPGSGWQAMEGTRDPGVWATPNYGWWYPRAHLTPQGKIWSLAWDEMFYIDPEGAGSITRLGRLPTDNRGATSASVMYNSGLVLQVGGGERGSNEARFPGSNKATIVDLNFDPPQLRPAADMNFGRHWHDAIVLPDGKVLVVGGSGVNNINSEIVYSPELWDPVTNTWTVLEANSTARLYHSTAVLMPDGSVYSGGGGAPGPFTNKNADVFYPPYLFEGDGSRAAKLDVTGAPNAVSHGDNFTVNVNGAADRVTLIKTNNATHSINSQIFQELSFTQSGNTLSITAPGEPNVATPGLYMLYVLDADGVPSDAEMVWLNYDGVVGPPPVDPPPPTNGDNLLANASFESNTVADGAWGVPAVPGWDTSRPGDSIEIWGTGHNGVTPTDGRQHVELNGNGPDSITQTVAVTAGGTYTWSIDHRGRLDADTMEVTINGQSQGQFTAQPGAWTSQSGTFTPSGNQLAISFRAIDSGGYGNLVDNVHLTGETQPPPPPPPGDVDVANFSFESETVADGAWGVKAVPGWETSRPGNVLEIWGTGHREIAPSDGRQFAELNGNGPNTVTQVLAVTAGATYRWSIDHQGRIDADTLEVTIDGLSQGRFTAQTGSWTTHSGTYTAAGSELTLSIRAIDAGSLGNLLDNIRIAGSE